jgi:osmoprotectant transport system ATP-binding protein
MIEFKNVSKIYANGFRAVDRLSLTIPKGEIVVLIGPSGCGKTTTMRMINRLIEITSGEILINGRSSKDISEVQLRREIGYAIQQIGLFPHMTISQNIGVVPRLLGWDDDRIYRRVDELLALVGLDPDINRDKYPRQLSGGQQQRVGVARALGADPPVMLMDEPFGAVDPITREVLQEEFLQIQQTVEKTIIFVTHDIDEAIKMGDRIAIMRDGHLVQYDTPETLLEHPVDRFVRDFVGADRQLKRLGLIRITEIMSREAPTVYMDDSVDDARVVVKKWGTQSAFVVDRDDNRLRGWVEREALEKGDQSLLNAMHEANYTDIAVRQSATAREALSAMVARGFRVTPVVDREGRLTGTITLKMLEELALYDPESYVDESSAS